MSSKSDSSQSPVILNRETIQIALSTIEDTYTIVPPDKFYNISTVLFEEILKTNESQPDKDNKDKKHKKHKHKKHKDEKDKDKKKDK